MTRAEIFDAVYEVVSGHSGAMRRAMEREQWENSPWNLPPVLHCPSGPCDFDTRTLRFIRAGCCGGYDHANREENLNEARIAWQRDQQGWAAERAAKECAEGFEGDEGCWDCAKSLGRCPAHRITPPQPNDPQCYTVNVWMDRFGNVGFPSQAMKGAKKTPMKSITQSVKRNALNAARKTAAKGVKDSARKAIVTAAQASDNPALHALAASLNTPHGDAALSVLVGVVGAMAMPALPGKLSSNAHVTELFDNLQLAGFEHFTDHAYTEIAEPIIGAIAGELMAYAGKMAALEGGARKALNAPAEGCDDDCDE